jgi:YbbR domain-containing protein
VDLSRASAGTEQFPVKVQPPDRRIQVVEIIPASVPVRLDEAIERSLGVRLNRTGNVPFGYEAGTAEIDPATVTVSGAASLVRRVDGVIAEAKLDGVTVNVDARVAVTPVDAQGQVVTVEGAALRVNPTAVRVRIPVTQQISYKTVGVQPNIVGSAESGFVIEGVVTEPPAITIVGPPTALSAVNFATTEQIDVSDAQSTIVRQVAVQVPEGVSVAQEAPVRVTVRVVAIGLTQSVSVVPVVEGVGPGLQVVSSLPRVQVVLRGTTSAFQGGFPSELTVVANASGLGPGTHRVTLNALLAADLRVQSINPEVITLSLAELALSSEPTTAPAPTAVPPTLRPTSTLAPTPEPLPTRPQPTPTEALPSSTPSPTRIAATPSPISIDLVP